MHGRVVKKNLFFSQPNVAGLYGMVTLYVSVSQPFLPRDPKCRTVI